MYMYVQYMSICKNTFIIGDAGVDMLSIYIHNYTHVPTYGHMVYRIQDLFLTLLGITERSVTYHALHISHRLRTSEKQIPANSLSGCAARAPDTLEPWWEPLVSLLPRHSHVHDFLGLLPFPADFFLIGLVVNGRQGWILPWLCVLRPERFARPGSQLLKQAQQPPFSDKPELGLR